MKTHQKQNPLCFMHLLKTAGASIEQHLENQFEYNQIAQVWNPLDLIHLSDKENINEGKYLLFSGHFMHCHSHLLPENTEYFTILRHPESYTKSIYSWLGQLDKEYWAEAEDLANKRKVNIIKSDVKSSEDENHTVDGRKESEMAMHLAATLSFDEFVQSEADVISQFISNPITRTLGDVPGYLTTEMPNADTEGHPVKIAIKNIKEYSVVGLFDRLEESMELLAYHMQWPAPPQLEKHNVSGSKNKSKLKNISPEAKNAIEKRNQFDIAVYKEAEKRFNNDYNTLVNVAGGKANVREYLDKRYRDNYFKNTSCVRKLDLKADSVWPGVGWGFRDMNEKGEIWRWIGGSSSILVKLETEVAYSFTVNIQTGHLLYILNSLSFNINGHKAEKIDVGIKNGFIYVSWLIEKPRLLDNNGEIEATLKASKNNNLEIDSIAFSGVKIKPLVEIKKSNLFIKTILIICCKLKSRLWNIY